MSSTRRLAGTLARVPKGIRLCIGCGTAPVAMTAAAYCFECWPTGPATPPPCLRCGATDTYFSNGLCSMCHPLGNPVGACPDCHAWGTTRRRANQCNGCSRWSWTHCATVGECRVCGRRLALNAHRTCRLCHRQARLNGTRLIPYNYDAIAQCGYQLFFANMGPAEAPREQYLRPVTHRPPVTRGQLALLVVPHDFTVAGRQLLHEQANLGQIPELEALVEQLATDGAWSSYQRQNTSIALRILHHHARDGEGRIRATDVEAVNAISLPVWTTLAVLTAASLLFDDRTPTQDSWYRDRTQHLPQAMRDELDLWYDVMKNGSATRPRRRPRSKITIELHVRWALPSLTSWANSGYESLSQVTREDVHDVLPGSGNARSTAGQGLKSIFGILLARKAVFANPMSRVKTGEHQSQQPVPVDLQALREVLNSTDIEQSAVVALIAFHGLRPRHLQRLLVSDLRDGQLHVEGRTITLARPVRERLRTYLDHRAANWPDTPNQHFFINRRSAFRTDAQVSNRWLRLAVGPRLTPSSIREDRILSEAHATGGDMKTLIELFGMSANATGRYLSTIDHPDLVETPLGS